MTGFQYLLQVTVYLGLFYGFYILLLRSETFFILNRFFLIASAILAFIIPVLQTEWIQSLLVTEQVKQVTKVVSDAFYASATEITISADGEQKWNTIDWLTLVYFSGVIFFLCRFTWSLKSVYYNNDGPQAYSFFDSIVVSEDLPGHKTILKHETVHAIQWHSADVLFFEIVGIFNWFNPIAYGYKKAIKNIHEFIADEETVKLEANKDDYTMLLLSNVFGIESNQLTNSFYNQSVLKQRIIMLYKAKSKQSALLKYCLLIPLFMLMVIFSSATFERSEIKRYAERIAEVPLDKITVVSLNNSLKVDIKREDLAPSVPVTETIKFTPPVVVKSTVENIETVIMASPLVDTATSDNLIHDFTAVEKLPSFPGGDDGFAKFIQTNYTYSEDARKNGISGSLVLSFIVEKDGSLTNIKTIRDLGMGTGEEAQRVMSLMPNWKPGIQNGSPVRVSYTLPLRLKLKVN